MRWRKISDFIVKARKKKEYEQITCRIEEDLLEEIKEIVRKNELGAVSDFIIQCIKYSLDNLDNLETDNDQQIQRREFFNYLPL